MNRVVHCKKAPYDVYIGRAAKWQKPEDCPWGNRFEIGRDGTRDEVIAKYEVWIKEQPDLMARLPELKDKTLGCWCAPSRCHGDVLARLVASLDSEATQEKPRQA